MRNLPAPLILCLFTRHGCITSRFLQWDQRLIPIILLFLPLIHLTSHFLVFDSCFGSTMPSLTLTSTAQNRGLGLDGLVLALAWGAQELDRGLAEQRGGGKKEPE